MATASERVDEFVKDYLLYRGLSTTLKTLEIDLRNEKEKGFRVDKIVEQLQSYVATYDLANLREYWNFLNSRLFARLEQRYMNSVRKLEIGLLKYYLVNASHNNKQDKILDFFDKMTEILQTQAEFKEWFAFPFVRNPKENSHFSTYFTIQWQDTFFLSLHNFLSVILQAMPGPVLLNFEAEHRQIKDLQEENEKLRQQIQALGERPELGTKAGSSNYLADRSHMDLVYDFSSLGEDTAIPETTTKSPKKFFTSSPLHLGKKNEKTPPMTKKKDDQIKLSMIGTKDPKSGKGSGSKLLPVITRQRKPVKTNKSQEPAVSSQVSESVTNQNLSEVPPANNKIKKFEDARQKRKELFEVSSDRTKHKDEKKPVDGKQESTVGFSRSVSEPGSDVATTRQSPRGTRRTTSKSVLETKSSMLSPSLKSSDSVTVPTGASDSTESGSPLASSTVAAMLGTSMSVKTEEMQTFPPPSASSNIDQSATGQTEQKTLETIQEKPFLLLSQDEYSEHRASVSYARFSNSGQYIASVDVDGVVKVWTWSPEAVTAATVMSKSAFLSLEWASKSDRWLLLGNRSGNIRLFDVKEMKSFYEATADPSYPRIVSLCSNPASPMFVCSATSGQGRSGSIGSDTGPSRGNGIGKLTLWDLKTMRTDKTLPLEPGPVCINSCSFNHNGQLLITGGADGFIRLFDVSQQKCISQWQAHTGDIRNVIYSADYNSCYSLGIDGKMSEWSMHRTGRKLRDFPIHHGAVPNFSSLDVGASAKEVPVGKLLALDSDGHYLLTCNDASAEIYRLIKDDPGLVYMMDLRGHRSSLITTVDWSPSIDTKICLTGYLDGKIIVSTLLSQ